MVFAGEEDLEEAKGLRRQITRGSPTSCLRLGRSNGSGIAGHLSSTPDNRFRAGINIISSFFLEVIYPELSLSILLNAE